MLNKNILVTALLFTLTCLSTYANASSKGTLPEGYTKYLTYIANGVFDPSTPHPVVPGCAGGFCDGNYFQREIMGRDQGTIDTLTDQAALFYLTRFGIDVYAPENRDRVLFVPIMFDPRLNYRAYVVSGMKVPKEGWVVRDGGWAMFITDPEGYVMGGEFSGIQAPVGSMFLYGEYNIKVTTSEHHIKPKHYNHHNKSKRNNNDNIIISYRAGSPAITNQVGLMPFGCETSLQPLTANFPNGVEGLAQGFAEAVITDSNGLLHTDIRNALTFNENGGR